MTKEDFKQFLKDNLISCMPEKFKNATIAFESIENEGRLQEGILFITDNQKFIPCLIIDGIYEELKKGVSSERVLSEIALGLIKSEEEAKQFNMDDMKNNIILRLVNQEGNKELMKSHPYKLQNDLLITYRVVAMEDSEGIHSALINNQTMNGLGLSLNELHELAVKNTMRLYPARVGNMDQVLRNSLATIDEFKINKGFSADMTMYVLTNEHNSNGASSLVYPGLLEKLSEKFGSSIYILPSSVDEVILLADNGKMNVMQLELMVRSVNQEQVDPKDRLSDSVYMFDKDKKCIEKVSDQAATANKEFVDVFLRGYDNQENDLDLEP